jgi:hypothetical protein
MEAGALSQTLDQNVLTVRGNAEGLFRFLTGRQVIPVCQTPQDTECDPSPLNNLELTSSFDVSGSNTQMMTGQSVLTGAQVSALLTSDKRQFASASARYVIVGSRDLRSPTYRAAWEKWYNANRTALGLTSLQLLQAQDAIFNFIDSNQAIATDASGNPKPGNPTVYADWFSQARQAIRSAAAASRTEASITAVVAQQYDLLEAAMRKAIPDLDAKLETVSTAYSRYFSATRAGFALAYKPLLTLEGTYSQPTLQPKLFTAKVIFAWSPKSTGTVNSGTLTLNGGFDLYTKPQPSDTKGGMARWRDAQFAVQFDRPLGGSGNPASLAIGAYVQYQMSPNLVVIPAGSNLLQNIPLPANATQILSQKGTIAVGYASLTLQIPSTGIRVPIGFSYSNRTELVTGNEIRGHIGFTFDTHSILLDTQR